MRSCLLLVDEVPSRRQRSAFSSSMKCLLVVNEVPSRRMEAMDKYKSLMEKDSFIIKCVK